MRASLRLDCDPAWRGLIEAWLEDRVVPQIVKETKARRVHRIYDGCRTAYVKMFVETTLAGRMRSIVRDRATHERRVLERLRERGVGAARPVASGVRDGMSWLATEEIRDARVLADDITPDVVRPLAAFMRAVHDAGVRNDDFHAGNVLVNDEGFHLVDVHRAEVGRMSRDERVAGVAFMLHSLWTRVTPGRAAAFVRAYAGGPNRAFAEDVWKAFQRERRRYWASRTARCLQDGREFAVDGPWRLRRPMTRAEAERLAGAEGQVIKRLPNRSLRVTEGRFVKNAPRSLAEWEHARALEVRHLPTPTLWAARRGTIVGEWRADARPLWEHLRAEWPSLGRGARLEFLYRLARLVRRLHVRGVYHKDLKANNLLVEGERFWVIDLDRVQVGPEVRERDRLFNLAQLNAAVGEPLSRVDRLRFYRFYAGNNRRWRVEWKPRVREIMRLTVARRHHWPPRKR